MRVLAKKMSSLGLIKVQMIVSLIVMAVALISLPALFIAMDPSLLLDPTVLVVVLVGMLMFAFFAYFISIRPYRLYKNSPEILAETDGEYLYIHGKKEAKIRLSELDGTSTFVHLPFIYSNELIATLVVHLVSEQYGDLDIDIPGYGEFKLRYVANVYATSNQIIAYINNALNSEE